jgi:hypothetical protein
MATPWPTRGSGPLTYSIADDKRSRTFRLPGADPTGGGPRWRAVREYPDLRTLGKVPDVA